MNEHEPTRRGPSDEALLRALELSWQDHIQTRSQTWRSLEIEAALVLGLIGADFKFENGWVTIVIGSLVALSTISGILITMHHRTAEIRAFEHIISFEKELGLDALHLLGQVRSPKPLRLLHLINPRKMYTPLFIPRMHITILAFTVIYVLARVLTSGLGGRLG